MVCELCAREHLSFRRMNRILRIVNSALRRHVLRHKQHADEVFLALCETDQKAEVALGELWGSAEFDCGPQDYEYMVEQCITAVRTLKAAQKPDFLTFGREPKPLD